MAALKFTNAGPPSSYPRSPLSRGFPKFGGTFLGGYMGIMENKMETTIWGLGFRD